MMRDAGRVLVAAACIAIAAPGAAAAQVVVGDSLWRLGRTDEAVAAYRRALDEDRLSVRANFRLAQTLAWSNNIDSALVLLRAARVRVPDDPDLLYTEGVYLSWAKRFPESIARYDSLIAAHPEPAFDYVRVTRARTWSWAGDLRRAEAGYREVLARDSTDRDATFGLAQVRSWSGDLEGGAKGYEALLASDPTEVRVLVALGNLRLWQGRYGDARRLADRAVARDSTAGEARDLRRAVAQATSARVELSSDYSEDTDANVNRWQALRLNAVIGDAIRAGIAVAQLAATDPARDSRRTMIEGTLGVPLLRGSLTGVIGVRQMSPAPLNPGDPAPDDRSVVSGRVTLQQRVHPRAGVSATVARWPFDEIAGITPLALDITQGELAVDWRASARTSVAASLGLLDWSDGNTKRAWSARATRQLGRGFTAGAFVSGFSFDERAPRYFSPPTFTSGEVTGGWTREDPVWSIALGGGIGLQKVDTLATQDQWHYDARVARNWAQRWTLELHGGRSTSAAASAVGAYGYTTVGLSLRRAF